MGRSDAVDALTPRPVLRRRVPRGPSACRTSLWPPGGSGTPHLRQARRTESGLVPAGSVSARLPRAPLRLRSKAVAQLRALKLSRRALAVQPGAGTLASRERRQAHHLEQLRSLFMEQRIPIVGCCCPQVGGFNVRHTPTVSAETNATVTISGNPFPSGDERFLTSTMLGRGSAVAR
jgi:hypothetical protein